MYFKCKNVLVKYNFVTDMPSKIYTVYTISVNIY